MITVVSLMMKGTLYIIAFDDDKETFVVVFTDGFGNFSTKRIVVWRS